MAEKTETARSARKPAKDGADAFFPANLADMSLRGVTLLTESNRILMQTARDIWEKEAEMFHTNGFAAPKPGDNPSDTFRGLLYQWHDGAEKTISSLRAISDLMRDCEWRLLSLAADNLNETQQRAAE